jgi:hypothetical protein
MPLRKALDCDECGVIDLAAVFPDALEKAVLGDAETARTPTTGKEIAEDPLSRIELNLPFGVQLNWEFGTGA